MQSQHLPELAYQIFSINSTQANCERNFSILNWILGKRQTNLSLKNLEVIARIRSYYMNNIQRELSYISKKMTEDELRESINIASVNSIIGLEDDNDIVNINGNNSLPSKNFSNTKLAISNIVDLMAIDDNGKIGANITPAQEQPLVPDDLNCNSNDILDEFLERERNTERNSTEISKNHE
jgi:hypothetical protein